MDIKNIKSPKILIDGDSFVISCLYTGLKKTRYDDFEAGLMYSMLSRIHSLLTRYNNPRFLIAWNDDESLRKELLEEYVPQAISDVYKLRPSGEVMMKMRENLAEMGFVNQIQLPKLESGDIIGHFAKQPSDSPIFIHSDNHAMLCLLSENVHYHLIRKHTVGGGSPYIYTDKDFIAQYEVTPETWITIRAISGYRWRRIPGLYRTSIFKALDYVRGEATETTNAWIESQWELVEKFKRLLTFPIVEIADIIPEERTNYLDGRGVVEVALRYGLRGMAVRKFWENHHGREM